MMGFFFFATASRPVLGATQFAIQLVPVTLIQEAKRPGREATLPFPNIPSCHGTSLCTRPLRHGVAALDKEVKAFRVK
jgi:hypothetical protein